MPILSEKAVEEIQEQIREEKESGALDERTASMKLSEGKFTSQSSSVKKLFSDAQKTLKLAQKRLNEAESSFSKYFKVIEKFADPEIYDVDGVVKLAEEDLRLVLGSIDKVRERAGFVDTLFLDSADTIDKEAGY